MWNKVRSISILLNLFIIVNGEPPSTNYGTPIAAPLSSYGTPNYHANDNADHYSNGEPKSYEFGYQVKDDYTGTNYNQKESSDGNQVRGEYKVALPDGRIQIVTYWADWQSGYHADVRYEGEAQYPEQYNKGSAGYNDGGYNAGGGNNYGYNAGPASNSLAINNLASGHDGFNNYDSYNNGYSNKAPPSNVYGPV